MERQQHSRAETSPCLQDVFVGRGEVCLRTHRRYCTLPIRWEDIGQHLAAREQQGSQEDWKRSWVISIATWIHMK